MTIYSVNTMPVLQMREQVQSQDWMRVTQLVVESRLQSAEYISIYKYIVNICVCVCKYINICYVLLYIIYITIYPQNIVPLLTCHFYSIVGKNLQIILFKN